MGKDAADPPPEVLHLERNLFLLQGRVTSSQADRTHIPSILLRATFVCTCEGSQFRDSKCRHLRALLESLDKEELVQWVLEAQFIPPPVSPK